MRLLATALLLAASLSAGARADDFGWPGRGTIRMAVPAGWSVRSRDGGDAGYAFLAQPRAGPSVVVQITLAALPPDKPVRADEAKARLEAAVKPFVATSVEKVFDLRPLSLFRGPAGWCSSLMPRS
jgi:hypothetical protein